jgi:uncharacterized protein YjbI with pentapeptide repeats
MEDYKIVKNGEFEGTLPDTKIIYYKCEITDFHLENSATLRECIFIHCHLKSMKITNLYQRIKLTFLSCIISDLHIEKSHSAHLRFFKSAIVGSTFQYSELPGTVFSKNIPDELKEIQEKLLKEDQDGQDDKGLHLKKELEVLSIHETEFLFCHFNDMNIDNTTFTHTAIKHCNLQDMKILENVEMRDIDLRGSNFFMSDFGECRLGAVRFNKSKYFVEIINSLLKIILKRIINRKYRRYRKKKEELSRSIFVETTKIRAGVKKFLYKLKLTNFADYVCSTTLINVQYGNTYFAQDIRFFWHMEDVEFVDNLKKKHPVFSSIMQVSSNNLRSFIIPLIFIFLIIYVFSMFYSTYGIFKVDGSANIAQMLDPNGHPQNPLYLSTQIFLNCGISPLCTDDSTTRNLIMFQIILGYFFLGTILGVVVNNFLIKPQMPKRWMPDSIKSDGHSQR